MHEAHLPAEREREREREEMNEREGQRLSLLRSCYALSSTRMHVGLLPVGREREREREREKEEK